MEHQYLIHNSKVMENQIILTKESSESDLRKYFEAILQLSESNEEFPVNLDEVWMLVYKRKDIAISALKKTFVQGIDYQVFRQKTENLEGGRPIDIYHLSTSCLEYFIARKVRPVFEVYRQVFHGIAKNTRPVFEIPKSFSEALLLAANQQKQIEEQQKMLDEKAKENKEQTVFIEQQGETIAQQEEEIKKSAPKVKYYDDVLNSNDLVTTSLIAKDLGMSAETLNRRLRDADIQYKQSNTWLLKSPYYTWNLGKLVTTPYMRSDGTQGSKDLWKWNQRGRLFINALVRCDYSVREAIKMIKGTRTGGIQQ